jgi:hypothetical protein
MWGALSEERMDLSFTTVSGPRQRSHSRIPSPAGLMTTFYCLRFETPLTWRATSPYLYPPGTGFPFRRLLRLAGIRWRYSQTPPSKGTVHGFLSSSKRMSGYYIDQAMTIFFQIISNSSSIPAFYTIQEIVTAS